MRTEALLTQSQSLASELRTDNHELQESQLLAHQNAEVERKNRDSGAGAPGARGEGRQLALTSKVQVEFSQNSRTNSARRSTAC